MTEIFEHLSRPERWRWLSEKYRRGCVFPHDGPNAARQIINAIQRYLCEAGAPLAVGIYEEGGVNDPPKGLAVLYHETTTLVRLDFHVTVVLIDKLPVFVAHDDGAVLLAKKIVQAVERVWRDAMRPRIRTEACFTTGNNL